MKIEGLFIKPVFKLLDFMFKHSTEEFYEKQLAKKSGISIGACNKYVKELVSLKILNKEKRGKMNFYWLNREELIVRYLKILFTLSSSLVQGISKMKEGAEVYLFGSFARGEDTEDSDLDLLIIGDRKKQRKIIPRIRKLCERYRVRSSIHGFERNEWIKMKEKDPAFYSRVEKDKIRIR